MQEGTSARPVSFPTAPGVAQLFVGERVQHSGLPIATQSCTTNGSQRASRGRPLAKQATWGDLAAAGIVPLLHPRACVFYFSANFAKLLSHIPVPFLPNLAWTPKFGGG